MKRTRPCILLTSDGYSEANIASLAPKLSRVCRYIQFDYKRDPISVPSQELSNPQSYKEIKNTTRPLLERAKIILIATFLPYDNNYFMDGDGQVVFLSFWGWQQLSPLSPNNGLVGFIASIIAQELDCSCNHNANTGCVYDSWWDKRGIDVFLRAGLLCAKCLARLQRRIEKDPQQRISLGCTLSEGLSDLSVLLDELSQASRRGIDILARWETKAGVKERYDTFLCHNSADKNGFRQLYKLLKNRGISSWFDEEHLSPGRPWQAVLEEMIPQIKTALVIVGANGIGPWQDMEIAAFLREFVSRGCPVIPVLLAEAGTSPTLPIFLRTFTWVDFRRSLPDPIDQLAWGITGRKPRRKRHGI